MYLPYRYERCFMRKYINQKIMEILSVATIKETTFFVNTTNQL